MSKLELDEKLVRKLSELLDETGLTEIEYETGGHRIRVVRGATTVQSPVQVAPLAQPAPVAAAAGRRRRTRQQPTRTPSLGLNWSSIVAAPSGLFRSPFQPENATPRGLSSAASRASVTARS